MPSRETAREPVGVGEVASGLWRRRWTLLSTALLGGALAAGVGLLLSDSYESTVTLLVDGPGVRSTDPGLSLLERVARGSDAETEVQLLQSRRVVTPVVEDQDLHAVLEIARNREERPERVFPWFDVASDSPPGRYTFEYERGWGYVLREADSDSIVAAAAPGDTVNFGGLRFRFPAREGEGGRRLEGALLRVSTMPEAVEDVRGRIEAERVTEDASLIALRCSGPSPEQARELCAGVSESYLRLRPELQRTEAAGAADFLEDQVARLESRLRAAEDTLEEYMRVNRAVALEQRASEEVVRLAELQARRDQLVAERMSLRSLIDVVQSDGGGSERYRNLASFPTFLQNEAVADLLASLVELENRRSELAVRRTDENPDLAALNDRVAEIEDQLRSIATSYERALTAEIGSLEGSIAANGRRVAEIPRQQAELARIQRHASLLDDLYRLLQTRLQEAEVAQAVTLPEIRIVDEASHPTEPEGFGLATTAILGLLAGAGLGLVLAAFREDADSRIRNREELEEETGLPVLSMIPRLREPGSFALVPSGNGDGRGLIRVGSKPDLVDESFRTLVTDLRLYWESLGNGDPARRRRLRSVAMIGSSDGEGKTFVTCHTALTAAASGRRVVLVDCDFRANGVSRFFRLPAARPGLRQVLQQEVPLQEALRRYRVGRSGELTILPSGGWNPESAGLLEGGGLRRLLADLGEEAELILLDTPPLTLLGDASAVAAATDVAVVVVRAGATDRRALEVALERLGRAGARAAGLVLNDVELPRYYTTYRYLEA